MAVACAPTWAQWQTCAMQGKLHQRTQELERALLRDTMTFQLWTADAQRTAQMLRDTHAPPRRAQGAAAPASATAALSRAASGGSGPASQPHGESVGAARLTCRGVAPPGPRPRLRAERRDVSG